MSKLSNPSRNINQFVYDFSRYEYQDSAVESKTISKVKEITQNPSSDDGIKEIQLEMLWKELKKTKADKKKNAYRDKKSKLKQLSTSTRNNRNVKDAQHQNRSASRKATPKSLKSRSTEFSAGHPSKTVGVTDARRKPLSTPALDPEQVKTLFARLQIELIKYGIKSRWAKAPRTKRIVLSAIGRESKYITIESSSESQVVKDLERALRLFTFKGNYTGTREQRLLLAPAVNFMWNIQEKRYSISNDIKVSKVEKRLRFEFQSMNTLLHEQMRWSGLSAVSKANLIREIRFRLGFSTKKESLIAALSQPFILEQLRLEQPNLLVEEKDFSDAAEIATDFLIVDKESEHKLDIPTAIEKPSLPEPEPEPEPVDMAQVERAFSWPSTVANMADGDLPESQWPQMGMLKAVGYSVGANGLMTASRQRLLKHVYIQVLPYVESKSYVAEWGEPKSGSRLKKMAETLAAFARNAKRQKIDKSIAISEWEQDLAWLKDEYYLKHKYTWVWPSSKNKKGSDEAVVQEKQYQSSRDFLVEQYTNKANELCCQICQSALPFKLENGEYFWEETPVLESVESSPFSDLVLCPNHRAMYVHANATPNQLLDSLGGNFTKSISINLAGENSLIFVSEKHQQKLRILAESYLVKEPVSPTIDFDISQVPKGLQGTKRLYLYEKEGQWVVSSRASTIHTLPSKAAAQQWIERFDNYRGTSSKIMEQVPTAKPKKANKQKQNGRSIPSVAAMRFGTIKKAEPKSSFKSGYSLCTTCNGDGGINSGCWKCGGSGWM